MKYFIVLIIATAFVLNACIDPLEIESDNFIPVLVIEGGITTEFGPHNISISKSAKYGDIFQGLVEEVRTAKVSIRDSEGFNYTLKHNEDGIYQTDTLFKAEIGETYILLIELDGKTYNSRQVTVTSTSQTDRIYPVYKKEPKLDENGNLGFTRGVDIYANYQKGAEFSDYYLWDYEGVYFFKTQPELFQIGTRRGLVPAPKDCCSDCYRIEQNKQVIVSAFEPSANSFNQRLLFLEDDGYRFFEKYVMIVSKKSITQAAYEFYELIKTQSSINGEIFDPPPATIRGNVFSVDDSEEIVVGYFLASDIKVDTLTVLRSDILEPSIPPIFKDDCLVLPNTTVQKPPFY